jgi:hypothetical protein
MAEYPRYGLGSLEWSYRSVGGSRLPKWFKMPRVICSFDKEILESLLHVDAVPGVR